MAAVVLLGVHVFVFWFGIQAGHKVRATRDQQIAIAFSGSQKTLMVGLQIAIDCGVSVIPMLVYHLCQLFIDTIVAERWKRRTMKAEPPDL